MRPPIYFVTTFHHAYPTVWDWWNPQDAKPVARYAPEQSAETGNESLQRLYGKLPAEKRYKLWLDKLEEVIETHQPDLVYHDVGLRSLPDEVNLDCGILDFEGQACDDIPIYSWVCDATIGPLMVKGPPS